MTSGWIGAPSAGCVGAPGRTENALVASSALILESAFLSENGIDVFRLCQRRVAYARMVGRRWDLLAAIAAVTAAVMLTAYVVIMRGQGDTPLWWVLAGLGVAAVLCGYAVDVRRPHRRGLLSLAGVVLVILGVISLLSIGCPILIAGIAALIAAATANGRPAGPSDGPSDEP